MKKTLKRSDLINLAFEMVQRYRLVISKIGVDGKCPVCEFKDGLLKSNNCELCFNKVNKFKPIDVGYGCVDMLTFEYNDIRLQYWEQVLEYLQSLLFEDVFIGRLRFECNEIDKKLM